MSLEKKRSLKQSPDVSGLEISIDQILDTLPGDLRMRWEDRVAGAKDEDLPNIYGQLSTFLDKRNAALSMGPKMFSGSSHEVTDAAMVNEKLAHIRESERRADLFVAEGKTAYVVRDADTPTMCHKIVYNFEKYDAWNRVDTEARFTEQLADLNYQGTRVPEIIDVIDRPDEKIISMEYFDAPSVDMVASGKAALPEDFDITLFFEKLGGFVSLMHKANVYHRDLHEGNVLIGADSTPYVIDFGQATTAFSPEYAYDAYDKAQTIRFVLRSDEDGMAAIKTRLLASKAYRAQMNLRKRS